MAFFGKSLTEWQRGSGYCSGCGGVAALTDWGHSHTCGRCKAVAFPRHDPAVIVLVPRRK